MHYLVLMAALAAAPVPRHASPALVADRAQDAVTQAPAADFEAEFAALTAEFEKAQEDFYGKLRALYSTFDDDKATDAERAEFESKYTELQKLDPSPEFAERFLAFAQHASGSEAAAKAWMQVIQLDRGGPLAAAMGKTKRALEVLFASHLEPKELAQLGWILSSDQIGEPRFTELMITLRTKSPHREVQASALRALAAAKTGWNAKPEDKPAGRALWVELKEQYGDVATRGDSTYGQLAEGTLFELDHLQVGCAAPDFEAVDETGAKFKLSDYRGKVVVVDFWGFW